MESSDTASGIPSPASASSPEEAYIRQINTEVYGDETTRETLWGIMSITDKSHTGHITKQTVANEAGLGLTELSNSSALEILEQFGIVELVPKVHRTNESYVLIYDGMCDWLRSVGRFGPEEPPDEDQYPQIANRVSRFGEYINNKNSPDHGGDDTPSPLEVNLELVAQWVGVGIPITVRASISSSNMNPKNTTNQWRLEMKGEIQGDLKSISGAGEEHQIQQEIFRRILAALHNHRIACPCGTIREHLINVVKESAEFVEEDMFEISIGQDKDVITFHSVVTKIKSDNNG